MNKKKDEWDVLLYINGDLSQCKHTKVRGNVRKTVKKRAIGKMKWLYKADNAEVIFMKKI